MDVQLQLCHSYACLEKEAYLARLYLSDLPVRKHSVPS